MQPAGDYPHRFGQIPHPIGHESRFWALLLAEKLVLTQDSEPMQFVTLEAVMFPDAFRRRGAGVHRP